MSLPQDNDFFRDLCCDLCHCKNFRSQLDYRLHYLAHKSVPVVKLARLSELTLNKLKHRSYKVNSGVARRTRNIVSPLRITLKKQRGSIRFRVVKPQKPNDRKSRHKSHGKSKRSEEPQPGTSSGVICETVAAAAATDTATVAATATTSASATATNTTDRTEVEASRPNESIIRNFSTQSVQQQFREERPRELYDNVIESIPRGSFQEPVNPVSSGVSVIKENPSVIKSISSRRDLNSPKTVSVLSKAREDANLLHENSIVTTVEPDNNKPKHIIVFKKVSGLGFSVTFKSNDGKRKEEQCNGIDTARKETREQRVSPLKISNLENFVPLSKCSKNATDKGNNNNLQSSSLPILDNPNEKSRADNLPVVDSRQVSTIVHSYENQVDYRDNRSPVVKINVRVRNSYSNQKGSGTDKRGGGKGSEFTNFTHTNLNGCIKSACEYGFKGTRSTKTKQSKGGNLLDTTGRELQAPHVEQVSSRMTLCQAQILQEQNNSLRESDNCRFFLGSMQDDEDCECSNFNRLNFGDGYHTEPIGGENNDSNMQRDDRAPPYPSQNPERFSFRDLQQDVLMSSQFLRNDGQHGQPMNRPFIRGFMQEPQPPRMNMPPENYMTFERFAHGFEAQHGPPNYNVRIREPTTPMEHLSQQVQRLPNPQVNVISHQYLPGTRPPQIHPGLTAMEAQQGVQELQASLPLLPQRPSLQERDFPSIVHVPRSRTRSYGRMSQVLPSTQDIPSKVGRIEPILRVRNQGATSSPFRLFTPGRRTMEGANVRHVLPPRRVTARPTSTITRPPSPGPVERPNPIITLSPAAPAAASPNVRPENNVAAPNPNVRPENNVAVPNPNRGSPIINENVERPARCATVDLTQDDESDNEPAPQQPNGQFRCSQCNRNYSASATAENHASTNRSSPAVPFQCNRCSASYPAIGGLQNHQRVFHKSGTPPPELAIPIVDLSVPGAREQLVQNGIEGFLPLSQLQRNNVGCFGIPIVHLDPNKKLDVQKTNLFATNVLVLGQLKSLIDPSANPPAAGPSATSPAANPPAANPPNADPSADPPAADPVPDEPPAADPENE